MPKGVVHPVTMFSMITGHLQLLGSFKKPSLRSSVLITSLLTSALLDQGQYKNKHSKIDFELLKVSKGKFSLKTRKEITTLNYIVEQCLKGTSGSSIA